MKVSLFFLVLFVNAFAAPSGFVSASATYHVDRSGTHVITSGNKAIIHWKDFSLNKGEIVKFLQANSQSAVLNRVKGPSISKIYGHIESNGKVFLLNGSGVLIGSEGRIDCAGFLASTANIPNSDFLAGGELVFKNFGKGDIINLGTIECPGGDVALLAKCVENSGSITAGNIYLASGTEVLLKPDGPISIQSSLGEVRGSGPYELAIKTEGKIVSQTLNEEGGKIFLISEKGKTEANGTLITSGGTIHVLGEEVVVGEKAFIDVSADHGAGEVLIGGDTQGRNPHIKNAYITTTKKGGEVHADSYLSGDAGKIIVWSDTDTVAAALATARAFGDSGNGGFIEASGGYGVATPTFPILTSKNGRYGTFLIDAGAITIDSSAGTGPKVWGAGPLSTALGLGSVIVDTGAAGVVGGSQIITITGGATTVVSWSTPTTLTLTAGRNISMGADTVIENTYAGSDSFNAIVMEGLGTDSGANWDGIFIAGTVESTKGDIRLTGTGGDTGGENDGIFVSGVGGNAGMISSIGTGADAAKIFLTGNGGTSTGILNGGVHLRGAAAEVKSVDGDITMVGNGGLGTGGRSVGLRAQVSASIEAMGSGNIFLTGTAGPNALGNDNEGVLFDFSGTVKSSSGNITATGFGGASGADGNEGINTFSGATEISSSAGGSIFLTGTGGGTGGANRGVILNGGSTIETTTGDIVLHGTGAPNATGSDNDGAFVGIGNTVRTTTGNITATGFGGASGTNNNEGVHVFSNGSISSSNGGNISLTGTGGGMGDNNPGIEITLAGSSVTTTTGTITLNGTGAPNATGNDNDGVDLGFSGEVTTTSGNIIVNGRASSKATGSRNIGFQVFNTGQVATTSGNITAIGVGGIQGVNNATGVVVRDLGSSISSNSGKISITGTGAGTGNSNHGVLVQTSAIISSGSDVTLRGTGGTTGANSYGVFISSTGTLSSTGGTFHIIGTGGGNTQNGISIDRATITGTILGESFSDIILNQGAMLTSSGSITLNASRDLTIQGGTATATNTSLTASGDLLLIAGRNLSILDGTLSLPVLTSGGNMTLVADNIFPNFPSRGPGDFIAQSTALLTSSGELRIYTVTPDQNTINAPLNGATFTPGSFGADTNTEKWVLYFNDGPYGGPNFTIYYKEGFSLSEIIDSSISISQMSPEVIQFGQFRTRGFNKISVYHAHFSPDGTGFAPYRAFIFEDDIYWMGEDL